MIFEIYQVYLIIFRKYGTTGTVIVKVVMSR